MTPDEILAKMRELRALAEQQPPAPDDPELQALAAFIAGARTGIPELCDLVDHLVARTLDLQQDLTDALDYAEHESRCQERRYSKQDPACTCGLSEIVARAYPATEAPPRDRIPGEVEAVARRMIVTGRSEIAVTLADGRTAQLRLEGMADPSKTTNALDRLVATLPEPPPGKMRATASVPVTYDVSPGQLAAYLRAKGWEEYDGANQDWQNWKLAGGPYIGIPLHPEWDDYIPRINEAVETLAYREKRSTGEVLRDIAAMEEA